MRIHVLFALVAACGNAPPPAPKSAAVWGTPDKAMILGLEVNGEIVTAFLKNGGSQPQRVIAKGMRLKLERDAWTGEVFDHSGPTQLDRDDSFVTIRSGDQLAIPIDAGAHARRIVGSGRAMEPGTYKVTASYNSMTAAQGDWWTGALEAGPVAIQIH